MEASTALKREQTFAPGHWCRDCTISSNMGVRSMPVALAAQGIEPALADVFDADAVTAVVGRAQPEIVIEQLTALPGTYTRQSLTAAADFNTRLRLEGGANVLAAAQAAGVRRYLRQSLGFRAAPGPGLADEETPLALVHRLELQLMPA